MDVVNARGFRLADPTLAHTRDQIEPAPRLSTLDGVALGLLANGKTKGDLLLELVVQELAKTYRIGDVLRVTKAHASQPPTEAEIAMLAGHSMAILSAIGD